MAEGERVIDFDALMMRGLLLFVGVVACCFFLQRLRWKLAKHLSWLRLGFYPSAGSMGNALQQLQVFAQPETRYLVAEKLVESAEDDEEGGPEDPKRDLLRQARRIQRGQQVGRLRVRFRP
jgi:hypothetical protein